MGLMQLSAGDLHSAALDYLGVPWTWGRNSEGQLGDEAISGKSTPVSVVGGHSFIQISAGYRHTLALKSDGTAWAWGEGTSGELGNEAAVNQSSPVSVVGNHSFIQIAAGVNGSYALKADGSAWSWGTNSNGALGDQTTVAKSSPVSVVGGHSFIQITYRGGLKADGTAWLWGINTLGQLGIQASGARSSPVSVVGGHSFIQLSVGFYHSLALKADGTVWAWGNASNGQLGDQTITNKSSPVSVVGNHSFIQVAANLASATGSSSFGRKADGSVWAWGYNQNYGQLGDNTKTDRSSPVSIVGAHSFIQVAPGGWHTLSLKADGFAWAWGNNTYGQLGRGTTTSYSSPVIVSAHNFYFLPVLPTAIPSAEAVGSPTIVTGSTVQTVFPFSISSAEAFGTAFLLPAQAHIAASGSGEFAFALDSLARPWSWGQNNSGVSGPPNGQLGDGTTTDHSSPVSVIGGHSFIQVAAGMGNGIGVTREGAAWGWGDNSYGQIGNGTVNAWYNPVTTPSQVIGGISFIQVVSGEFRSFGLAVDGSVWGWGWNLGWLGDGTASDQSSPVLILGGHSFVEIAAGDFHVLARKANGQVWSWGRNFYAALGDGTKTDRSIPVSVVGNHSFIQVAAGDDRSLALKADGSVWAWGRGNLGDGTVLERSSPVAVIGGMSFIQVACGWDHSLALKADGTVWSWGVGSSGQLGEYVTIASRSSPVSVAGNHSFVEVAAGYKFSLGLKANNQIWSWGANLHGQLGNNAADLFGLANESSPVLVAKLLPTTGMTIYPDAIPSAEAFGTPIVSFVTVVAPAAIPSAEAFGTPRVSLGTQVLLPTAIPSAEAFGAANVTFPVNPGGILIVDQALAVQTIAAYGVRRLLRLRTGRLLAFRANGIVTSTDLGQTWTPRSAQVLQRAVEITTGPNVGRLVGYQGRNVYVSGDAGITWMYTATVETAGQDVLEDAVVQPGAVLLLLGTVILRSVDGGLSFDRVYPAGLDMTVSTSIQGLQYGPDADARTNLLATTWLFDNRYVQFALNDGPSLARRYWAEDRIVSTSLFGTRQHGQRIAISGTDDHLAVGFLHGGRLLVRRYLTDGRDLDLPQIYDASGLADEEGSFDLSMDENGDLYAAYVRSSDGAPVVRHYTLDYGDDWERVEHGVTIPNPRPTHLVDLIPAGGTLTAATADGRILQLTDNELGSDVTLEWQARWWLDHDVGAIWSPDGEHFLVAVGSESFFAVYQDGSLSRWRTIPLPTDVDLQDVWGADVDDVWAVGGAKAVHFDGTTCTVVPTPAGSYALRAVYGFAGNDVYAAGTNGTLLHWNGLTWSQITGLSISAGTTLTGIWGSSGSDVWIGTSESGKLLHFTGSWSNVDLRFLIDDLSLFQLAVSFSNPTPSTYAKGTLLDENGLPAGLGAARYVTEAQQLPGEAALVATAATISGLAVVAPVGTPIYQAATLGGWTTVPGNAQVGIVTAPGTIKFVLGVSGTAQVGWSESSSLHYLSGNFGLPQTVEYGACQEVRTLLLEFTGSSCRLLNASDPLACTDRTGLDENTRWLYYSSEALAVCGLPNGSGLDVYAVRDDVQTVEPFSAPTEIHHTRNVVLRVEAGGADLPTKLSEAAVTGIYAGENLSLMLAGGPAFGTGQYESSTFTSAETVIGHIPTLLDFDDVAQLVTGNGHNLLLRTDGTVWSWGYNVFGQLGLGDTTSRSEPTQIPGLTGIVAIAAGGYHSLAVKSDGSVYAWGYNTYGQLGLGTTIPVWVTSPTLIPALSGIVNVAAGAFFSMALTSTGGVYCWGYNFDGEVGNGTVISPVATPYLIPALTATQIVAGPFTSLALVGGQLYGWGRHPGNGTATQSTAVAISGMTTVVAVSAAPYNSFASPPYYGHRLVLKANGTVWVWGENLFGQFGNGTQTNSATPVQVGAISDLLTDVIRISAGGRHSLAQKSDGSFWAWGSSTNGQLGNDAADDPALLPVRMEDSVWTNPKPWTDQDFIDLLGQEIDFVDAVVHQDSSVNVFGDATARWDGMNWFLRDDDIRTVDRHSVAVEGHVFRIEADGKTVRHFDGTWHVMTVPTDEILWAVHGRHWTDVWFVGRDGTVLHYDGNAFQLLYFVDAGTEQWLYSVYVHDTGDVFIGGWFGTLLHYNGSIWQQLALDAQRIDGFSAIHNGDVYAYGREGTLLRLEPLILGSPELQPALATGPASWPTVEHKEAAQGLFAWCWDGEVLVQRLSAGVTPVGSPAAIAGLAPQQTSAALLPDGRHAVAFLDGGSAVVHFFSATGTPLSSATQAGALGVSIVVVGSDYVLTWRGTDDVLSDARYSAAGALIDGPFVVGGLATGRPSAAWTGDAEPLLTYEKDLGGSESLDVLASRAGFRRSGSFLVQRDGGDVLMVAAKTGLTEMLRSTDGGATFSVDGTLAGTFTPRGLAHHAGSDEVLVLLDDASGSHVYRYRANSFQHRKTFLGATGVDLSAIKVNWWTVTVDGSRLYVSRGITTNWYEVPDAFGVGRVLSNAVDTVFVPQPLPTTNLHPLAAGTTARHALITDDIALAFLGWGLGASGQLGDGAAADYSSPVAVAQAFLHLSCGGDHSLGLQAGGTAWGWGSNAYGQLGNGSTTNRSAAVAVASGHVFTQLAAGYYHSLALKSDGSAWAWGNGSTGALGDNNAGFFYRRSTPVSVVGGHSFTQVAAGFGISAGLKADGTLWTWGYNFEGELGDGTTLAKSSPVSVLGGHSFIQVAVGEYHCLALKADGTAWAWGYNAIYGQLGDGTTTSRTSPVPVTGGHSFIQVTVGEFHSLARKADGSVWGWGSNSNGRLGDGTTTAHFTPTAVIGGHSFTQVVGRRFASLALKADGTIWAWGQGADGLMGNGSTSDQSSPTLVARGLTSI